MRVISLTMEKSGCFSFGQHGSHRVKNLCNIWRGGSRNVRIGPAESSSLLLASTLSSMWLKNASKEKDGSQLRTGFRAHLTASKYMMLRACHMSC